VSRPHGKESINRVIAVKKMRCRPGVPTTQAALYGHVLQIMAASTTSRSVEQQPAAAGRRTKLERQDKLQHALDE